MNIVANFSHVDRNACVQATKEYYTIDLRACTRGKAMVFICPLLLSQKLPDSHIQASQRLVSSTKLSMLAKNCLHCASNQASQ